RRDLRDHGDPIVGYDDVILDAYAAPAGKVCARLDREDHSRKDRIHFRIHFGAPPGDAWILVDFETQAVTGAMAERVCAPALAQRITGRGVDSESGAIRRHRLNRTIMSVPDGSVHLFCPRAGASNGDRARQVDAV